MSARTQVQPAQSAPRQLYYEALQPLNLAPLWNVLQGLVPAEPVPAAKPWRWGWSDVYPQLLRAGELISAQEAERRVLVLENPGLPGKSQVTDTLYGGLQLILSGEVAPAHRHTQSALRFVLHGDGAYTAVDGEKTRMHRGDFIITPHWMWHDHGHEGTDPVVWLDGLDVPLVSFLRAGFRESHELRTQALERIEGEAAARFGCAMLPIAHVRKGLTSPLFSYPYERARQAVHVLARAGDPDPHLGICLKYVNPLNGDWAMPTLGTALRYFPASFETRAYRSTDSLVLVGLEGRCDIVVEGGIELSIGPNDIVAVPGWTSWSVRAVEDTVLFSYSDRPVHEKLALLREQRL